MPLLNVRLGEEDSRIVRELRDQGVSISAVVREALREEARRRRPPAEIDVDAALAEIMAEHPTPSAVKRRHVSARDRQAVQALVRDKLRGRR